MSLVTQEHINIYDSWKANWNLFAKDVLKVTLDREQQKILAAIQHHPRVAVCSGTARGKDFITAVACICFMYLTPTFDKNGVLVGNTKVVMTGPTAKQVKNIMYPEITRLWNMAKVLPGRLVGTDIRTEYEEWFLTGFTADKYNQEAWTGLHAVNTMFAVTEATGIDELVFEAIEGNLQGNSRFVVIFNPNTSIGYAANTMRSKRFKKFTLNSLSSPNVLAKKIIIPGQVDYVWVKDKVETWCEKITEIQCNKEDGDFEFEKEYYRPNDKFRKKVLGKFPKVSEDSLIPMDWILQANENWKKEIEKRYIRLMFLKLGVDVAGMGRDLSVLTYREENYVQKIESFSGKDATHHMELTGYIHHQHKNHYNCSSYIDTIGEGAGVYSRLEELMIKNVHSCKYSYSAKGLTDITGEYSFVNMRAYLFWCVREWFNPKYRTKPCFPPDAEFLEEATQIIYKFKSDGKIMIEPKENIKKRIGRSTDKFDSFANTFYPYSSVIEDNFKNQVLNNI